MFLQQHWQYSFHLTAHLPLVKFAKHIKAFPSNGTAATHYLKREDMSSYLFIHLWCIYQRWHFLSHQFLRHTAFCWNQVRTAALCLSQHCTEVLLNCHGSCKKQQKSARSVMVLYENKNPPWKSAECIKILGCQILWRHTGVFESFWHSVRWLL